MGSSSDAWLAQNSSPGSGGGQSSSSAWLAQNSAPATGGGGSASALLAHFGGHSGGLSGFIENAVHSGTSLVTGTIPGLIHVGGAVGSDLWTELHGHPAHQTSHLVENMARLEASRYAPLIHGNFGQFGHEVYKDPLFPVLDALTVASLGGGAALKGAEFGALGDRAAAFANTERVLSSNDLEATLNQARTLQGRIRQRAYDRWSMKPENADRPFVGANQRIRRILDKQINNQSLRAMLSVRKFQRVTKLLTKPEKFAFHVAAEGVPLDERITYYENRIHETVADLEKRDKRLAKSPPTTRPRTPPRLRRLQDYLAMLKSPEVHDAIMNPRDEFIHALEEGKRIEGLAGAQLVESGALTPEQRATRAAMPQDEMMVRGRPSPPGAAGTPVAPPPTSPPPTPTPTPLAEPSPPWVGAPTAAPEPVVSEAATYPVTVQRNFFSDVKARGEYPEGAVIRPQKPGRSTVRLTVNQAGLRHIMEEAKKDGGTSAKATLRKLEGQMHKIDKAEAAHARKLSWRHDKATGSNYVPGTDYHVDRGAEAYVAMKGEVPLGEYRTLPEAKARVERDAEHLRNATARAQREAAAPPPEAKPGIAAESFTEPTPVESAPATRLTEEIRGIHDNIAKAEKRLSIAHDPAEIEKLGHVVEKWRAQQNSLIEEWMHEVHGAPDLAGERIGTEPSVTEPPPENPMRSSEDVTRHVLERAGYSPEDVARAVESQRGELYRYTRNNGDTVEVRAKNMAEARRLVREKMGVRTLQKRFGTVEKVPPTRPVTPREAQAASKAAAQTASREGMGAVEGFAPASDAEKASILEKLKTPEGMASLTPEEARLIQKAVQDKAISDAMDAPRWSEENPPPPIGGGAVPSMDVNLVNPRFPAPYRFMHTREGVTPGSFIPATIRRALGKQKLAQLEANNRELLQQALFLTDPERVLVRDYLSTMRWHTLIAMQRAALDPISKELTHDLPGGKGPDEWYYRPSYDAKTTATVARDTRFEGALNRDRAVLDSEETQRALDSVTGKIVAHDNWRSLLTDKERVALDEAKRTMRTDAYDRHLIDVMREKGIRRVPHAFGSNFAKEFRGTHWAIRMFYDRPMDVWRMITLNLRPAWAVNNFVGNALMGLATYGPMGAYWYIKVLASVEKDDGKWLKLVPKFRRKYGNLFGGENGIAHELHSAGFIGTNIHLTHPGIHEGVLGSMIPHVDSKALKVAGLVPKTAVNSVRGVARGLTHLEVLLAEDTGREAAFIRESMGDIKRIRAAAKKMGEGNISVAQALRRMDQASIDRAVQRVNDALGDFNDLSPFERQFIRRIVPFYSWYKVITKVSAKYAARYPARLLLLKNIEAATNTDGENVNLPDWLAGSVLLGGPANGVQGLISTQGLNPYQTLPQTISGGPLSAISPILQAPFYGAGVNPSFGNPGQPYTGFGATKGTGWPGFLERAAGGLVGSTVPFRTTQQATEKYKGKLYAPKTYAQVGPLSVNDFLLQFLGLPIRHVKVAEAKRERGLR